MILVYSLEMRSQPSAPPLVGVCVGLVELILLMLFIAPLLYADELLPSDAERFDPNICYSFDISRRDYAEQIYRNRFADNRFSQYQQMKIASIEFARVDVFDTADPNEDNPLFRLINSLNIRTRESTLKPLLQFSEGDLLDPAVVAESERSLRARSYLSEAFVMPIAACNAEVHLLVVTQDAWTTQPIISVTREGGNDNSKFGLVEGNFLGTGSEISVIVEQDEQRRSVGYQFKKDYLLGKPIFLSFGLSDNSDGYARGVRFGKPFYTDQTKSALDFNFQQSRARISTEQNGLIVASYQVEQETKSVYAGLQHNLSALSVTRIFAGLTRQEELYSEYVGSASLVPDVLDQLSYPWIALEHQSTDFMVMKNVDFIEMTEDIRIGGSWRVSIGYSPEEDLKRRAILASAAYSRLFILPSALFSISTHYNVTVYQENDIRPDDRYYRAGVTLDYRWLLDEKQRLASIVNYNQVNVAGVHRALSLGGEQIVRGYPANYLIGNKIMGGSLEYRYHSEIHLLNIIHLGWAAYVDVGVLQNDQFDLTNQGYDGEVLSNLGVGLRITSSKTHVGNMLHIDFAMPTGYKKNADNYQILLRAVQHF